MLISILTGVSILTVVFILAVVSSSFSDSSHEQHSPHFYIKKIMHIICDRTCEKGPCRASFQNRVITTIGKSRL